MTIEEMKAKKRELGYSNKMVAELSGIPLGTVQKIFAGMTKSPRRETVLALQSIFEEVAHSTESTYSTTPQFAGVREETVPYNAGTSALARTEKKKYTIDDYYALPDERRVELIDGVFYDMAAPSALHQGLLGQLHLHFAACLEKHPECELFFAPLDVRLDNDNYTMVQPDLLIVCNRKDEDIKRINGAPDFVLEVLSPSSRAHDSYLKLGKYDHALVREYWIVDPEKQKVVVYDLEHQEWPVIYSFHDRIPIRISGGECSIDFAAITKKIERYLK